MTKQNKYGQLSKSFIFTYLHPKSFQDCLLHFCANAFFLCFKFNYGKLMINVLVITRKKTIFYKILFQKNVFMLSMIIFQRKKLHLIPIIFVKKAII